MRTRYINHPENKHDRTALRYAGHDRLKKWITVLDRAKEHGQHPPDDNLTYVKPDTFTGQAEGYFRYSVTGNEEIRFYHSPGARTAYEILFVYLDYTTGVTFDVTKEEWAVWMFNEFRKSGILEEHRQRSI